MVVSALAACSSGGGDGENPFARAIEDTVTTTAPPPPPLEELWTTPGQFVTRPVLVAGRVVSYVAQDGGLALVAHDPVTGAEVWRRASTVSSARAGIVHEVVTDGSRVFHLTPGDGGAAIEAVDVASGQPAWQSAAKEFGDIVEFCDDVSGPLCTIEFESGGDIALWRLAPDTGMINEFDDVNGHDLDGRLYDLEASDDIARVVGGAIVWQRPDNDLFGGAAVSADSGWFFREIGDLIVGSLGAEGERPADGEMPVPARQVAGLASADGTTRWIAEGDPMCWRIHGLNLRVGGQLPWLRCKVTGTLGLAGSELVSWSFTSVVVEGFDPVTGATTWTADLGAASAVGDPAKLLVRLGPNRFAVQRDDGTLLAVNVETGRTATPEDGELGWCLSENEYAYSGAAGSPPTRSGQPFTTPCDLTGEAQPGPVQADDGVGVVVGDIFVWTDPAGLHGSRITP